LKFEFCKNYFFNYL